MFENIAILTKILQNPANAIPTLFNEFLIKTLEKSMKDNSKEGKNLMYVFEVDAVQKKLCIRNGYMQQGVFVETCEPVFIEIFVLEQLKSYPKFLVDTLVDKIATKYNKKDVKIENIEELVPQLFSMMSNYIIEKGNEKEGQIKYLLRFKNSERKSTIILETCWYDDGKVETMNTIEPKKLYSHFENQVRQESEKSKDNEKKK